MYRISFVPQSARWVVQLQVFGLFWRTVQTEDFTTFHAAEQFVERVGLPSVYRNYHDSPTHQIMAGVQPYYPPQVLRTKRA